MKLSWYSRFNSFVPRSGFWIINALLESAFSFFDKSSPCPTSSSLSTTFSLFWFSYSWVGTVLEDFFSFLLRYTEVLRLSGSKSDIQTCLLRGDPLLLRCCVVSLDWADAAVYLLTTEAVWVLVFREGILGHSRVIVWFTWAAGQEKLPK